MGQGARRAGGRGRQGTRPSRDSRGRGRERDLRCRTEAPPQAPPVPGRNSSSEERGGGSGVGVASLLSGTSPPGKRGRRSALLLLPQSCPFSPCLRAGIAQRLRRWSARTAEPSGQFLSGRDRAGQGPEWWAAGGGGAGYPAAFWVKPLPGARVLAAARRRASGPASAPPRPLGRQPAGDPAPHAASGSAGWTEVVSGCRGGKGVCRLGPGRLQHPPYLSIPLGIPPTRIQVIFKTSAAGPGGWRASPALTLSDQRLGASGVTGDGC